jgi:hypothetical protein
MDDSTRKEKIDQIVRETLDKEFNESLDEAARQVKARQVKEERGFDITALDGEDREAVAKLRTEGREKLYENSRALYRETAVFMLELYERQPHPASVSAAALVAEALVRMEFRQPGWYTMILRPSLTGLAEKILLAFKPPEEPN